MGASCSGGLLRIVGRRERFEQFATTDFQLVIFNQETLSFSWIYAAARAFGEIEN